MNDSIIRISIGRSPQIPDDYHQFSVQKAEREISYELFKKIDNGEYNSVRVSRREYERDIKILEIEVRIGNVMIVTPEFKFHKILTLRERLKVLFTGYAPL